MNRASQVLTAVIISTLLSSCLFADQPDLGSATVGIQSVWKPGVWTPVVVPQSICSSPLIAIEAVDDDGVWIRYPVSQTDNNYCTIIRTSKRQDYIKLLFADNLAGKLALPKATQSHREVVLVIGDEDEAEFVRLAITHTDAVHKPVVIQISSIEELNAQLAGGNFGALQVIDRVVWFHKSGSEMNSPELIDWLRYGGDLTISTLDVKNGTGFLNRLQDKNVQYSEAPASQSEYSLTQTRSLEQYSGSDQPIPKLGFGQQYNLKAVRLSVPDNAVVECSFIDLPLVYRQAIGFGRITVVAIDLNAQPIQKWSNRERLLRRVMDIPETVEQVQRYTANAILHYGYDDLSGQLASSLDQYKGIATPSFWIVAALLIVYIVLIGAGDYFLWRKLRLPTWITWISFPIYIIIFSALFYGLSQYLSPSTVRTNWAGVIDVDYSSGLTQQFFYGDVLVPKADVYHLSFEKTGEKSALIGSTTWFGSTGQGISGMNSERISSRLEMVNSENSSSGIKVFSTGSVQRSAAQSTDLPERNTHEISNGLSVNFAARSTRNILGRFTGTLDAAPALAFSLQDDQGKPHGTITNQTKDVVFSECMLLYGQWAFPIGEFKPGQSVMIDDSLQRYSLNAVLVGKKVQLSDISVKYSNETIPYNPIGLNPEDPLRAMMFYRASGGVAYTKLESGYHSPTDFSSLIKLNRAVLLCKVSPVQAEKTVCLNVSSSREKEQQSNALPSDDCRLLFYRFIIPISK